MDDEIIVPWNDNRTSFFLNDEIIVSWNNDDDEIIVPKNDDVKSSFLDDNKSSFQGTMSFLLKWLEPARASDEPARAGLCGALATDK